MASIVLQSDGRGTELCRDKAPKGSECSWCGQAARFVYYGASRVGWHEQTGQRKPFCSIGCFRDYSE